MREHDDLISLRQLELGTGVHRDTWERRTWRAGIAIHYRRESRWRPPVRLVTRADAARLLAAGSGGRGGTAPGSPTTATGA